jgi:hypothetical protein
VSSDSDRRIRSLAGRRVLGATALTLLLATAACGGGQDGGRDAAGASTVSASARAVSTAAPTSTPPASTRVGTVQGPTVRDAPTGSLTSSSAAGASPSGTSGRGKAGPAPTAPNTSQLRKNVTAHQRRFVTRNAPPGVDAEAILQAGEDACHRMRLTTATSGRTSVAVALLTGQIGNGREAITYLCPELRPALAAAASGFPDGTWTVAAEAAAKNHRVAAGRYSAPQPTSTCTWTLTRDDGSVVAQGTGAPRTPVALRRGEQLTSAGCVAWLRS